MKIGTSFQLVIIHPDNTSDRYKCKLIDKHKDQFIIDYPVHDSTRRTAILANGTNFIVHYVDEGNVYRFRSKVLKRVRLKNIPGLAIERPSDENIKRIQRRNFARVNASVNIAIHSPYEAFEPYITVTHDISGGGVSIIAQKKNRFEPGMAAKIWLVIQLLNSNMHYISANAEVVGKYDHGSNRNRISFKFTDISESERQSLISFVFEKQREERRKELL